LNEWTANFGIKQGLIDTRVYGGVRIFSYSGGDSYSGEDTRQALSTSADRLESQLTNWSDECAREGVQTHFDIVAHSLGGAVTAVWAADHPSSTRLVRSVLSVASPLGGIPSGNCLSLPLV